MIDFKNPQLREPSAAIGKDRNSRIMEKSTQRHEALEPLSREHRHSLQLCDRIRKGLARNVNLERIRSYTDWFRKEHLERHFEMEEKQIFPMLGTNPRVKRALANHRRIRRLLSCGCENLKVLNLLEEELATYIRFEEQILFRELEKKATPVQLAKIKLLHEQLHFKDEEWKDNFWTS